MTGVITSLPPLVEQPPGNNSSNPAGLPGVTYSAAIPILPQTWTGLQTFKNGSMQFAGSTSGNTFLNATAIASGTLLLPAVATTDTLLSNNNTATVTNKSIDGLQNTLTNIPASSFGSTTGTGPVVLQTSPSIITPSISGATITTSTFNGNTWTAGTGVLTLGAGKTLTASNTLTLAGTDGSTVAFGTGGTVAYTANNLSVFAATTSAQLRGVLSDKTGTGLAYFQSGDIGTPSAGVLTNATGLPIATGIANLGTGVATFLNTPSSANLRAALTDEVGTGAAYFVGGALGTPASATLTNGTGLPISTGLTGTGTGVLTALAVNVGSAGAPVVNGGVLGTPLSGTLTNATGLPLSTGVTGNLPVANLNNGTGANATSFWRGDGAWAAPLAGGIDLNVKTGYGAVGNDIAVTATITISSGSPNLTATGATFVFGDVGKQISIPSAGSAGAILQTTILTFTDATHVVLAANASITVTAISKRITYGTDDTTAINNAIASAGTGDRIIFPPGNYRVSTLSSFSKNISMVGTGLIGCVIRSYVTTGDIIRTTGCLTFKDLTIDSIGNRTSGASLNLAGNGSLVSNFAITNCYIGVTSSGVLNRLQEGNIPTITSRAVSANSGGVANTGTILACYNVSIGSGTAVNADMAEFGFRCMVGEIDLTQCYVFQVNQAVQVTPGSGQTVLGINLKGCWFDTIIAIAVNITPTHATAIVQYVWISDCWLAPGSNSANGYGLVVDNTIVATLSKIWVCNSYILTYNNNSGVGVYLNGANLDFSMIGGQVGGQNFGFSAGIQVTANTTKWSFVGVAVTYNGTGFTFAAGADNYIFNSNRVQNNSSAGVDSSTPTTYSIAGNIGYDAPWKTYTPTITSGTGSFTTITSTGRWRRQDKTVFFELTVTITNAGTAGGSVSATLPVTSTAASGISFVCLGRETAATGVLLQGIIQSGTAGNVIILKYDNTFQGVSGNVLAISGMYEAT